MSLTAGNVAFTMRGNALTVVGATTVNSSSLTLTNYLGTGGSVSSSTLAVAASGDGGLTISGATGVPITYQAANSISVGSSTANTKTGDVPNCVIQALDGGRLTSGSAVTVGSEGGAGRLNVDGANGNTHSTVNVGTNLVVGSGINGVGRVTVTNGGLLNSGVTSSAITTAGADNGNGRITVSGTGSTWTQNGNVYLGGNASTGSGAGELVISSGAAVTVNSIVKAWNTNSGTVIHLQDAASKLTVNSLDLDGDAANLDFTGGTLTLTGGSVSGLGSSPSYQTLADGGTLAGSGTVQGNLSAASGKIIFPGTAAAPGTLNVAGSVSGSGTATMQLVSVSSYGKLVVGGNLSLGVVDVDLVGGYSPAIGAMFDLFDFATLSSGYTFDLPALEAGKQWDTSQFAGSGVLIVAAPEPGTTLLGFVAGVSTLGVRRRNHLARATAEVR